MKLLDVVDEREKELVYASLRKVKEMMESIERKRNKKSATILEFEGTHLAWSNEYAVKYMHVFQWWLNKEDLFCVYIDDLSFSRLDGIWYPCFSM